MSREDTFRGQQHQGLCFRRKAPSMDMRRRTKILFWTGLAAGIVGFLALGYVLFGPTGSYQSSGEQCASTSSGPVCTQLPTESGTTTTQFEPGSAVPFIYLGLLAGILVSILATMLLSLHSRSRFWKLALPVATGILFILAVLGSASIGLFFLPSVLLALCASIAAGNYEPLTNQPPRNVAGGS